MECEVGRLVGFRDGSFVGCMVGTMVEGWTGRFVGLLDGDLEKGDLLGLGVAGLHLGLMHMYLPFDAGFPVDVVPPPDREK